MAQQDACSNNAPQSVERAEDLPPDQAISATRNGRSTQNAPVSSTVMLELERGNQAVQQGAIVTAIDHYQQALTVCPDSPEAYQALAEAFSLQGQLAESAACYRKAIELLTQVEVARLNGTQPTAVAEAEAEVEAEVSVDVEELYTLIQSAEAACAAQQWQAAINSCRQSLELQPSARAYKLMGNALQASGAIKAAMQSYQAALQLQPNWAEVYANLGSLQAQQQQWPEAIAAYEQALQLKPDFAGAYRNLARIWTQLDQPEQATQNWYQALRLEPTYANAQEHFNLGNQLLAQNDVQAAVACYRQAIQQDPDFAAAHQNLATVLMQAEGTAEGDRVPANSPQLESRIASEADPSRLRVATPCSAAQWMELGMVYAEQQQWNQAITAYRTALSVDADLPQIYQHLGNALKQQGEILLADAWTCYQQAIQIDPDELQTYHAAIDLNPDDGGLYCELARALERQGDRAGATVFHQIAEQIRAASQSDYSGRLHRLASDPSERVAQLQQATEPASPDWPRPEHQDQTIGPDRGLQSKSEQAAAYLQQSMALQQQGRLDESIAACRQATQLNPQWVDAFHQLGHLLLKQEQWQAAADAYRQAIQLNPADCWSQQGLADALMPLQQWAEAAVAYQQAAALNPTFFWSHQGLADALMQLERWQEAAAAYQQAIQQKDDFYWSHYNLGDALAKLAQWDQAVMAYRRALTLEPSALVYQKLGDALQNQSHPDLSAAFDCYQQAIAANPHDLLNYHKAIELQPQNSRLYVDLANALKHQEQIQQAILFYQMALQLNPTDVSIQQCLEELAQPTVRATAPIDSTINSQINSQINSTDFSSKVYPVPTTSPKFSVVVPIYDRTQLLHDALVSIRDQTCADFEVLLVLDGSPPATVEVAQQFLGDARFRMYSYPEAIGNACRGRNRGILEARGDYIALLDSDDLATPERLAVTLAAFEQHNCDAVVGKAQYLILENRPNLSVNTLSENQVVPLIYAVLKRVNPIVTSTISIRRDVLLKYGGFRPEMRYREDHELWLRLVYHGCRMVYVDQRFAQYRLHKANNELNFKAQDSHWIDLMHQSYRQPFVNWGV